MSASESTTYDVHVADIAPQTTQEHLNEFFSFCGKIAALDFDAATQRATIRFEKPGAAKTALMLNGGALDGAHLAVTSPIAHDHPEPDSHHSGIEQTDKPRSAIAAEYLARGYTLSDQVLQKAIAIDNEKGISKRFLEYFWSIDKTVGEKTLGREQTISGALQEGVKHAEERARQVDQQRGISTKATDVGTLVLCLLSRILTSFDLISTTPAHYPRRGARK